MILIFPDALSDYIHPITSMIRQYPREDLIVTGRLFQVAGWFPKKEHTEKEVIATE